LLNTFNPAVTRKWLFLLAGMMWSAVGVMLCSLAYRWLADLHSQASIWIGLGSSIAAILVYRYGFIHIAQRNIHRLQALLKKTCVFAFMPWKSYFLVAGMMALGIILRSSSLPHVYLAVIYITIGAALFLSSLHYYPHVWNHLPFFPAQALADIEALPSSDDDAVV
jgi:hypothetical protein